MKYKNLLVLHCTHDPVESLKAAVGIARSMQAHLHIMVLNLAPPVPSMALSQNPEFDWSSNFRDILGETTQRVEDIDQWIHKSRQEQAIDVTVDSSCQQLGLVDNDVAAPALYADLVLYHRCNESMVSGLMAKAIDGVIFSAAKPALILSDRPNTLGDEFRHITIAWDPVPSAMKALNASLPFLARATDIELLVVRKREDEKTSDDSVSSVSAWLSRHGINTRLQALYRHEKSVSTALLEYVNASSTDMVVMGAYGHSKFSERFFGGVSYKVLEKANKTLFIAH